MRPELLDTARRTLLGDLAELLTAADLIPAPAQFLGSRRAANRVRQDGFLYRLAEALKCAQAYRPRLQAGNILQKR